MRALSRSSAATGHLSSTSLTNGALHVDDGILPNGDFTFEDDMAGNDDELQFVSGNDNPSIDLSMQNSSLEGLDGIFAFDDYTSVQRQRVADVSEAPYGKLDQNSGSWCDWMCRRVSLSVVTSSSIENSNSNPLAILQMERPHAQHSADIIIQALRSLPTMMIRRETFPWFIHRLSNLLSKPTKDALPEALSACMGIAQMFASRTPETKHLLSRAIRVEYRRFMDEVRILLSPRSSDIDHQKDVLHVSIRTPCSTSSLHDLHDYVDRRQFD